MINYLKTRSKILMFSLPALALFFSCTDLEIEATDSLLAPNFEGIATAEEAASQVSAMYNSINGYIGDQANLYALSEVTTDEITATLRIVPNINVIFFILFKFNINTNREFINPC